MKRIKKSIVYVAALIFWAALWWVGAALANRRLLIKIPTPPGVLRSFCTLVFKKEFLYAAAVSLARVLSGFLLAAVFGVLLGLLSHYLKSVGALFRPFLQLVRAVPVASFIFLVYLWMKDGAIPVLTVFLIVLPIVAGAVESGFSAVDGKLLEMAKVFSLTRRKTFFDITVPALLPSFSSALVTGIGFGFKAGVAAEIICRPAQSVGNLLWASKSLLDYEAVFAYTLAVVIFSALLEMLIRKAVARIGRA